MTSKEKLPKYIRGGERIVTIEETVELCKQVYENDVLNYFVLKSILDKCPSSDNIEDLCDDFIEKDGIKYGIFNSGELVAKMNQEGKFELI